LDPLPSSLLCYNTHHHHRLSHTLFSLLSLSFSISISISKVHPLPLGLEKDGFVNPNISISKTHPFSLQFQKLVGLFIQTSPSPKFIHFPCSFQNVWVYPSKHLHLQNSSIYLVVSKMGGFIHPKISISRIHPLTL
jgi:hypothetical protein